MFDLNHLYRILNETTAEFRKGEVFEGTPGLVEQAKAGKEQLEGGGVLEIYMMPHIDNVPDSFVKVDVEFEIIGVDPVAAEEYRNELIGILKNYPEPERLAGGPSYIEVGGVLGDQSMAFRLFALGHVLGLWKLITPGVFGFTGAEARELAGSGMIMITGFNGRLE